MPEITIHHNPECGTSRNTLAIIRHAGIEPEVIEYLKQPPSRQRLRELIDFMLAHPILINRPIVATPLGVKLCRPSEEVLEILPSPTLTPFTKEDGEVVVDTGVRRA